MNEYKLLKQIFSNLYVNENKIPVNYLTYKGDSKTYVTYTFIGDDPTLFADNKEVGSIVSVDVDIYSDGNLLNIEERIIELMIENDFIRKGTSPDMYEEDTKMYHKTIEFEKERMK